MTLPVILTEKQYLGDGIYGSFDGYATILNTEDGIRATNIIVMEPHERRAVIAFLQNVRDADEAVRAAQWLATRELRYDSHTK